MQKSLSNLNKQLANFEQLSGGVLGIHAIHHENNIEIKYKSDLSFLMCSTYKLPMAILLLQKVEQGTLKLTDIYEVTQDDLRPGVICTLNQFNYEVPLSISIINLLQLMLQESSNTTTDILLGLIGGPTAVTKWLRSIGIQNMRVDRYTLEIMADWDGTKDKLDMKDYSLARYKELEKEVPMDLLISIHKEFKAGKKDTSTPEDMTNLLIKLLKNELLNPKNTDILLNLMRGCKRGQLRLLGLLPHKTPVAHKTGTLTGFACDVGIITLPNEAGSIAISVFIKESNKELEHLERIIAEVGRTIYDYFLFN